MLFLLSLSFSLLFTRVVQVNALELSTSSESFPYHVAAVNSSNLGSSNIAAAWYAGWHAQDFPLSKVSWSKYTHMVYAFASVRVFIPPTRCPG
jgi:chitinase